MIWINLQYSAIGAITLSTLSATIAHAQYEFPPATPSNAPVMSYPSQDNLTIPPAPTVISPAEPFDGMRSIPSLSSPPASTLPQQVYRVEVMGSDPFLLSQVQTFAPDAFVRQSDGTIQVGSFSDSGNAQRQADLLATQGIRANIVTANVEVNPFYSAPPTTVATNPYSKTPPNFISAEQRYEQNQGRFFVVIPGSDTAQVSQMAQRVLALGLQANALQERSEPLGLHLAVGPFASRSEAEVWNTRLRANGMDARLFFE